MTILEAKGVSAEGAPSLPLGASSREAPGRCHSEFQCWTPTLEMPGPSSGRFRHLLLRIRPRRQWSRGSAGRTRRRSHLPRSWRRQDRESRWSWARSRRHVHRSRQCLSIGGDAGESDRSTCGPQRKTVKRTRTPRGCYSRPQPDGRHQPGGTRSLWGSEQCNR